MSHLRLLKPEPPEPPEPPTFNGKRLAQARELRGLTVEDLAELMNILPIHLNWYELGGEPDNAVIIEFSLKLDFPMGFFFQDDPPQFGPSTLDWHVKPEPRKKKRV